MPPGWEEHYDEIADANYYYHVPTQLTTWDKPTARYHRSVSVGAHTPGVKKFSLAKITHLPEGWEQHTDPATGQYYYENTASDEKRTTWSAPAHGKKQRSHITIPFDHTGRPVPPIENINTFSSSSSVDARCCHCTARQHHLEQPQLPKQAIQPHVKVSVWNVHYRQSSRHCIL